MRVLLLLAVCLLGVTVTSAAQTAHADRAAFSPGDAVRVTVWQYAELSGQFDIDDDGSVLHPIYREIRLAGMSQAEAQAEFRRVLQRFEVEPRFVVEPLYRITIGGEVRIPSVYTVTSQTTVLQALAQAGGPTPQAQLERVRLLRDGAELTVDLRPAAGASPAVRLRSGDQIMVDARRDVWRRVIQPALTTLGSLTSVAILVLRVRGDR